MREATIHLSKARATSYCRTSLACIEQRLSLKKFAAANRDIVLGRKDPYASIILGCAKAAAPRVRARS